MALRIGGILIGRDIELMNTRMWKWQVLLGGNTSPFRCISFNKRIEDVGDKNGTALQ
jgi:hypothetical protein